MTTGATSRPTVTVAVPVLDEARDIDACLAAVDGQTYGDILEVLVVDGGSTDDTAPRAARHPRVRLLVNPRRIQAAALNVALAEAKGDVVVRIDGHCVVAADYVERCVDALERTGAAMVGGPMRPVATGRVQRAVALAMASPLGAGPARFHLGRGSGWVDTVYLGAYRTRLAREVGGYDEGVGVNEDAEFALRMGRRGGVWLDESICSTYVPRDRVGAVARQFFRYGRSRAATVRKHPGSIAPRQLIAPALVVGLLLPGIRRRVLPAYGAVVVLAAAGAARHDRDAAPALLVVLPAMHLSWGIGFFDGLARPPRGRP